VTLGTSLFLIAIGAILKFAVTAHVEGIDNLFARSRWTAPGPPHTR
jgi:hypothetical protein